MDLMLAGRGALVTGASSGIGRGIALALAREGVRLVVTARREAALAELCEQIEVEAVPVVADFLDPAAPEAIAAAARDALGDVEILVNNAGGSRPFGKDASEAQWEEALTLNFTRHRQLTGRLLGGMAARGWGRVINITGKSEPEGVNGAFAAKAALHSWAKGLSREVGRDGITVNCIPPGRIMSEQIERNYPPEHRARHAAEAIPVGEYGRPEDIADLVCFLASPRARYITGAVIPVDGGLRRYQF
jgi:3-oxoacyl-[acyl-carrier protein] reductase